MENADDGMGDMTGSERSQIILNFFTQQNSKETKKRIVNFFVSDFSIRQSHQMLTSSSGGASVRGCVRCLRWLSLDGRVLDYFLHQLCHRSNLWSTFLCFFSYKHYQLGVKYQFNKLSKLTVRVMALVMMLVGAVQGI